MHCPSKELIESSPCVARAFHGLVDHYAHRGRGHFVDVTHFGHLYDQSFSYRRLFPFHGPVSVCEYAFEPGFMRKRNERERHRVRCVNEGYARLREHLPHEFEDKRLSKVETLRAAIGYIKHLQSLLELKSGTDAPLCRDGEPEQ